jgi:hypothetical protein
MTSQPEPAPALSLTGAAHYAAIEDLTGLTARYIEWCQTGVVQPWPGVQERIAWAEEVIARAHNPHRTGVIGSTQL